MLGRVKAALGGGSSNQAYVTARVRAMKTFLLPSDTYPKLLARDVHEIARTLQEGRYKEDVDALAGRYAGARLIELSTRRAMGREFETILSFCKGGLRNMLQVYLERFDVFDAKTALRGVVSHAKPEEVRENILPGGTVPDAVYETALSAGTLPEAVDVLAAYPPFAPLAAVREKPLPVLEDTLDRAYYERLVASIGEGRASQAFLDYIKHEIDTVNLKAVLRLKHAGLAEYALIPNGAEVDDALVRRLLAAQPAELGSILDGTSYGPVVKDALARWAETRDMNPVVTALEQHLNMTAQRFGHLYPLSILPLVDYVRRKRVEVDNLRVIAVGKAAGLDDDTIRGMVMT